HFSCISRSFTDSFHSLSPLKPWVTKLSSAGLVYFHFGHRVLMELTRIKPEDPLLEVLFDKVYEGFVEEVDAIDNGISQTDEVVRYSVTTTLSNRVSHLNPHWNSREQDTREGFHKAMAMVGMEFKDRVDYFVNAWIPAREIVEQAIKTRHQVDVSGEIILLDQGGCPWKEHLFSLEQVLGLDQDIKFVLYRDQNERWRVQCVPQGPRTFNNRYKLSWVNVSVSCWLWLQNRKSLGLHNKWI
ncbi:hypothetical protein DNTS_018569, partial [Danionella cerebrum]